MTIGELEWVNVSWPDWLWSCERRIGANLKLLTLPRTTTTSPTQLHLTHHSVLSASHLKQRPNSWHVNHHVASTCYRLHLPNTWRGWGSLTWAASRCAIYPNSSASSASKVLLHRHHTLPAAGQVRAADLQDCTGPTTHHLSQNLL